MPDPRILYLKAPTLLSSAVSTAESASRAAPRADRVADVDRQWDLLLVATAVYTLAAVGRVHELFPAIGMLRPAILSGAIAVLLLACDGSAARRWSLVWVPTTRYVLLLLLSMALATSAAIHLGRSIEQLFDNFLKTVLMYLVIVAGIRGVRDAERLALAYLASAAVYAAVILIRFDLGAGDAWRLGRLYYYDANDFATLVASALPLGLYALHRGRGVAGRALGAVALSVLALALVYTGSRGGFIAALAVIGFVVLGYRAIALRWRLCGAAIVLSVVVGAASEQYWRQMTTIVSDADYNRTEETGRLKVWQRGIGYMLRHPVFGLGPGNFQTAEGTLSPLAERQQFGVGVQWNAAHNSLVQAGAELGIPGLLLFIAVIASGFRALQRSGRRAGPGAVECLPELTQALTAALLGFVVGAFFLSLAYAEMLYTLVAIAAGLEKVSRMR